MSDDNRQHLKPPPAQFQVLDNRFPRPLFERCSGQGKTDIEDQMVPVRPPRYLTLSGSLI
jgi:hypothetical protein